MNCYRVTLVLFLSAVLCCLLSLPGWAQTTVTFDEITTPAYSSLNGTGTYDNSGGRFSIIPGSNPDAWVSSADNGFGGSKALDDNNTVIGGVAGWSIKKADGSDFQLVSIWLQEGADGEASTTGTIKAYNDNAQIGSTVNLTFDSRAAGAKVFSSNPDFENVDEIRIEATDVYLLIDNVTLGPPVPQGDDAPAVVTGINLVGTPFSTVTSVDFTVNFSKNVTNVSADDFQLTTAGTIGNIASVAGSGSTYTVTVNGLDGEGTVRLDLKADTDIANGDNAISTPAYTGGQLHYVGSCYTETFESKPDGAMGFSSNGRTFTLGTGLGVEQRSGFGAGDPPSNRYIKNNSMSGTFTITADDKFTIGSVDLFLSDQTNDGLPTGTGTLTIVGRLEGADQFTVTKNAGFPLTATNGNNGFFTVNFAMEGGTNNSNKNIDELVITIGDGFKELGIDNFNFCEAIPEVDNQAPAIQSLTLEGTPESTAGAVTFQAVFNEIAENVTLDDFSLHTTNTATGTLSALTGSGTTYTLQVTGVSGEGTIQVRLNGGTDIKDELGNTPPIEYVNGQLHYVGACYVETFEAFVDGATGFVSNGKNFSLTGNWEIHRQSGFGINASDVFLLNTGSGPYTLRASDVPVAFSRLALYLSSNAGGAEPTNDGTLTIRGKNAGSTVYEITKNTGFPTDFGTTNGFFFVDFATDGAGDYSGVFVDALEIEVSGFVYLALDDLGYCSDFDAPAGYAVTIDQELINPDNETAVSFTFADAEMGTAFNYTFTSSGGGTPVSGTGTITSATQQLTGIDLSGLAAGTVTLSVTLTDASGNEGTAVTDGVEKIINNPPTDISLDNTTVYQSGGNNAVVGTLTSTDEDTGDTHSYTLVTGTGDDDNTEFNIGGNSLQANDASTLVAGSYGILIQTEDNNGGTFSKPFTITVVDDIAPSVSSVSVPASGTYRVGQNLDFTVNLTEAVTVNDITGTPSLPLTFSNGSVAADYVSGSGTAALVFRYTIQPGDVDDNGVSVGVGISLNGSVIGDGAGNNMDLTLGSVNASGILVDGVAPTVKRVDVPADDTYGIGIPLSFTVHFNEPVDVNTTDGTPRIPLTIGSTTRYASYATGSGTSALVFTYTVASGDEDGDGVSVGAGLELNGGTLRDAPGNAAVLTLNSVGSTNGVRVDGVAPAVSSFIPVNGATDVEPGDNLLVTFTEGIALGTGSIMIYEDDATPIATIDVANHGGQLSVTDDVLTINPTTDLLELTGYYVHIGNDAIHDLVGNAYAGINNNTIWAFTVADITAPSGYDVAIDQATITLANHDALSFTFNGAEMGATFDYEITSNNGGTSVTGNGTITAVGQQVSGIDVSGMANGTLTLSVTLTDAADNESDPVTDNVTKAVGYPPTITTSGGTTTFTESVSGSPVPVPIDGALTVSDPDNTTLVSATVAITGNFQSDQDVLAFVNNGSTMGDIDGNYSTGTLTLTSPGATATLAQWQAALRAVTYSNTSLTPNTANRTISFVVNDGFDDSTPGTKTVAVQAVNNAPVITNLDGDAVTFTEDGPAILIDEGGDATVTDSDSPDFDGGNLTVSVIAGGVGSEDMLAIRNEGMGTGQIGASADNDVYYGGVHIGSANGGMGGADLIVTFLPTATPAAVQALIRNLTYSNSNIANPSVDPRTVCVTLNDGDDATSAPSDLTVNITAVNDAPMVTTSGGAVTFTEPEDGDPVPVTVDPGLTVTDPDNATLASATISITSGSFQTGEDMLAFENDGSTMGNIDGSYNAGTGILTLTSSGATAALSEWMAALREVTYSNSSHHPSTVTRTISFVANDGATDSSPATRDINIVAVNTAPVNTVPVSQAVDQDSSVVFSGGNGNAISVSDVDAGGGTIRVGLTAVNGLVTLRRTTGLTFSQGSGTADGTMTFEGTVADINRALDGLIFVPTSGYNGPASLQIVTDDLARTGSGGPKSDTDLISITVNPINPAVVAVGSATPDGLYKMDDVISLTVSFDQPVTVDETDGSPGLLLETGNTDREAIYVSGTGSNTLTFSYTVQAGDESADLNYPSTAALLLNGATIRNAANQDAVLTLPATGGIGSIAGQHDLLIDGVAPVIVSVGVPADGYHVEGDVLEFTVNFGEQATVDEIGGTPYMEVIVGTEMVEAAYVRSRSTANALVFRYMVQAGEVDLDGVALGNLVPDGGTIRDAAGNDAVLALNGVEPTTGVLIYAIQPSVALSTDAAPLVNGPFTVIVTFSEAVTGLTAANLTITNGTAGSLQTTDNISYTLEVTPVADGDVTIEVPADAAVNVAGNGNTASGMLTLVYDGTAPAAPVGLSAEAGDTQIALNWTAGGEPDVAAYRVYGGTAANPMMLLGTVTHPLAAFTHTGLVNGTEYAYRVSAVDEAGNEGGLSVAVRAVPVAEQTITFDALDAMTYGDDPLTLTATASSGLAISYSSSDESVASISGDVLTVHAAGTVTVTAGQDGNVAFHAADPVLQTLVIDPATLSLTVNADQGKVYGSADPALAYTAKGFALTDDEAILTGGLEREPGEDVDAYAIGLGNLSAGDNYTIDFTEADFAVTPLAVTVIAGGQTKVFGEADPELSYTVSPALVDGDRFTGTLSREPGEDAGRYEITQGTLTLNDNYTVVFTGAALEIIPSAALDITLPDGSFVYDGAVKSLSIKGELPEGVTVRYEIDGKPGNGATEVGTYEVTVLIDGGANYEDLKLTATLRITPAERALDFPALAEKTYGDADFDAGVAASSGEAISYTSSNVAVAEVTDGGLIRIVGAGEATITATVPENNNYSSRPQVSRVLTVVKASQAITFNAPAEVNRDAGSIALDVSASSGLPVSLSLDDEQVATLEGTTLNIHRLGTVTITATQAGDGNYEGAEPVTVTVKVVDPSADFAVRVHPAVSPNGDGINEFLMIEGIKDFPDNRVSIFSRNGTMVWEAEGYDNANTVFRGTGAGGLQLAPGTYFYIVEIRVNGRLDYRKGYFVLRY